MDYEYLVTISPDNHKKWEEMLHDPEAKRIMLLIYQLVIEADKEASNSIVENCYKSFKEGRIGEHYDIFCRAFNMGQNPEDIKSG